MLSLVANYVLLANAPNLGATPFVSAPYKDAVTGLSWQFNQNMQATVSLYLGGLNISTVDFFGFVTGATMMPEAFGFSNAATSCLAFGVVEEAFCKDRDGHLFWDAVHPTKKAHALIGEIALGQLPALY